MKDKGFDATFAKKELAPKFEGRLLRHEEQKGWARQSRNEDEFGMPWTRASGVYSGANLISEPESWMESGLPAKKDAWELCGVERSIANMMVAIIAKKGFVVICDFGGMRGGSMIKIVKAFEEDEKYKGKVTAVITNLGYRPELDGGSLLDEDDKAILVERKKMVEAGQVCFVQADAVELENLEINGKKLAGQIDILHEKNALMHGYVNDRDIPAIGRLMSPDGIVLLSHIGRDHMQDITGTIELANQYDRDRYAAHKTGLNLLQQGGMVNVNKKYIPPGYVPLYDIFCLPESEPILELELQTIAERDGK